MSKRVLVVEDEEVIREFIVINLKRSGYDVTEAATGEDAIKIFENSQPFDVALLDINLPGIDGLVLCRMIRDKSPFIGIMMLTARTQEIDRVNGLMTGADDYVTKPFSPGELIARVDALYRRASLTNKDLKTNTIIRSGDFVLNSRDRTVHQGKELLDLTQVEYLILRYFLENYDTCLSTSDIYNHVWGAKSVGELKIVDVNVRRLRMKIEADASEPMYIQTVWGMGYKWALPVNIRRVTEAE